MLIDLHTHTSPLSWDSFLEPDELVERSKQSGLDAIVLSEHDASWDAEEVKALSKRHNFIVLAGMEINTEEGHILVYGMHKYVFGMHRVSELAGHVDESGGIMFQAHPYRRQHPWNWESEKEWVNAFERSERNDALNYVHGLEVLNGRGKINENQFAQILRDRLALPGTAGTDSHAVEDIGKCATYFDADIRSEDDLIDALRNGRYWPLDVTKGEVTKNEKYWEVPQDLSREFSDLALQRSLLSTDPEQQAAERITLAENSVKVIQSISNK